jgi:hypothetical protein
MLKWKMFFHFFLRWQWFGQWSFNELSWIQRRTTSRLFMTCLHHNLVIEFSHLSFPMILESLSLHSYFEKWVLQIQNDFWKWIRNPIAKYTIFLMCIIMSFDQIQMSCKSGFTIWLQPTFWVIDPQQHNS